MARKFVWMIALLTVSIVWADEDALRLPTPSLIGARAMGMGDAALTFAEGAEGAAHNPASLGVGRGVSIFGQTNLSNRDAIKLDPKGIAYHWRGTGVSWVNRIVNIKGSIYDHTFIGVGKRLSSRVAVGVTTTFRRVHPSANFQVFGESPTFQIGALAEPRNGVRIGARVGQAAHHGGIETGAVGASWATRRGRFAVEAERRPDDWLIRAGIERALWNGGAARIGWRDGDPSVGLGQRVGGAQFDAAWTRYDKEPFVTVGAEWTFGRRLTTEEIGR
ncbi:MAG: hypothetical protein O3A46_11820 [Candidatus Poribacteria bacterium]|nr:hypothetical protein [Candidatus Poribacteria bacterium]